MTLFPWLYNFTSVPFGYVCVHIYRTQKFPQIYVLALYAAWFRNYMQSSRNFAGMEADIPL